MSTVFRKILIKDMLKKIKFKKVKKNMLNHSNKITKKCSTTDKKKLNFNDILIS